MRVRCLVCSRFHVTEVTWCCDEAEASREFKARLSALTIVFGITPDFAEQGRRISWGVSIHGPSEISKNLKRRSRARAQRKTR